MFETDLVRELRLRKWAREHFVAAELRKPTWHPIVLDEMNLRDQERAAKPITLYYDNELDPPCLFKLMLEESTIPVVMSEDFQPQPGSGIVPLFPEGNWMIHSTPPELHGPHWQIAADRNSMSESTDLVGYW